MTAGDKQQIDHSLPPTRAIRSLPLMLLDQGNTEAPLRPKGASEAPDSLWPEALRCRSRYLRDNFNDLAKNPELVDWAPESAII